MTGIRPGALLLPILILLFCAALTVAEDKTITEMKLSSPAFANAKAIPASYSCDGGDLNPPLSISGVPRAAKSLALIMDDPDAPGGVWVHWVLWNIDPATVQIPQGSLPTGAQQGLNGWQRKGYGGPCPPSGTHRYFFRLYALKERLELPATADRKELERAMLGKILAQGELYGVYSRK
jgi:Raf kinase inhibitor-like YbhB/YbcL family protein